MLSRDRSRDITHIRGNLCPLGQWRACRISSQYKQEIRASFVHQSGWPSIAQGTRFFAYSVLIINFKGVLLTLKIIALEFPWNSLFLQFIDVLMLSYKPSNFARAILPYVMG